MTVQQCTPLRGGVHYRTYVFCAISLPRQIHKQQNRKNMNEIQQVFEIAKEVILQGIHLADSYEDYFKLKSSLSTLGETGRGICRSLCEYCDRYNPRTFDRDFSEAMRNNRSYTIATFYEMVKGAGVDIKRNGTRHTFKRQPKITSKPRKNEQACYLPFSLVERSRSNANGLFGYLAKFFSSGELEIIADKYLIGSTKDGKTIYWQVDGEGHCHTGKIMAYDSNGHRIKSEWGDRVDWVHSRLQRSGRLPKDWQLSQCLFGEHLLRLRPNAPVCVVEGEKTAVIMATFYPQHVWVATGGKGLFSSARCSTALAGREVYVFADVDATEEWTKVASALRKTCKSVDVSDWYQLEGVQPKWDIADWCLMEWERERHGV